MDCFEVVASPEEEVKGATDRLGAGELACIRLCSDGGLLLMDDRVAGEIARENGVEVTSIPGFLIALRKAEFISLERILETKRALEDRDHYVFEEGFEERLKKVKRT